MLLCLTSCTFVWWYGWCFLLTGFLCRWNFCVVLNWFHFPFWWHFGKLHCDLIYVFTIPLHTWCSMFRKFTSDQQFTSWNFELVISNDDNNSPKESKCFQQQWHFEQIRSKLTSLSTARHIYHWLAHKSVSLEFAYSPYSSHPRISHCSKIQFSAITDD